MARNRYEARLIMRGDPSSSEEIAGLLAVGRRRGYRHIGRVAGLRITELRGPVEARRQKHAGDDSEHHREKGFHDGPTVVSAAAIVEARKSLT